MIFPLESLWFKATDFIVWHSDSRAGLSMLIPVTTLWSTVNEIRSLSLKPHVRWNMHMLARCGPFLTAWVPHCFVRLVFLFYVLLLTSSFLDYGLTKVTMLFFKYILGWSIEWGWWWYLIISRCSVRSFCLLSKISTKKAHFFIGP